jgi:hypothetical protein
VSENRYCATINNGSVRPCSFIAIFLTFEIKLSSVNYTLAAIACIPLSAIIIGMVKHPSKSNKLAPKSSERTEKCLTFREATRLALDLYHETLRDLARYDREEKPLDTIPY